MESKCFDNWFFTYINFRPVYSNQNAESCTFYGVDSLRPRCWIQFICYIDIRLMAIALLFMPRNASKIALIATWRKTCKWKWLALCLHCTIFKSLCLWMRLIEPFSQVLLSGSLFSIRRNKTGRWPTGPTARTQSPVNFHRNGLVSSGQDDWLCFRTEQKWKPELENRCIPGS